MKRRPFVQALGAASIGGLAGCLSAAQVSGTTPSATETPSRPTVRLADSNGFADAYPVTFDVSVVTPTYAGRPTGGDHAHPATVKITLTNTGDEPKQFGLGHRTVFSTVYSDDGKYALLAAELAHDGLAPDCWKLQSQLAFPAVVRITDLPSGASKSRTFDLVTSADAERCLPSGEVPFQETYAESVPSDEYTPARRKERSVSFTLHVS